MSAVTGGDACAARRPGRPRSAQAERAILDATLDLLGEVGIEGLTVEAVAAQACCGKATVYRRWSTKDELIAAAVATLNEDLPTLAGRSVRDDLVTLLAHVQRRATRSVDGRLFPRLMSDARQHPELVARYHDLVVRPRRRLVHQVLERGVRTGELRADLDPDLALTSLVGTLLHALSHHIASGTEAPGDLPERIVTQALRGLAG